MRSAGNFHPEWGCLAPSQSFIRFLCIALASTAIGATSGAVVMNSLLEGPGSRDGDTSVAAHALVSKAPVIVAPAAEMTSFVNTMAAAALIAEYMPPKPPAHGATPASTTNAVASAHEPSRTASRAIVSAAEHAAGSVEKRRIAKAAAASPAAAAKVAAKRRNLLRNSSRDLPRERHWQTATDGRNYRLYNQEFRPSFQPPDNRPFVQPGFSQPRDDW